MLWSIVSRVILGGAKLLEKLCLFGGVAWALWCLYMLCRELIWNWQAWSWGEIFGYVPLIVSVIAASTAAIFWIGNKLADFTDPHILRPRRWLY